MFTFDLNWQFQHLLNPALLWINIAALFGALGLAILGYRKTGLAVGALAALPATYVLRSNFFGIPFTYLELCIWAVFAGWLIERVRHRQPIRGVGSNLRWPILLIVLGSLIGLFLAPDLRAAAGLWKAYILEPLLVWLLVHNVANDRTNRNAILFGLGLGALPVALLAVTQWFIPIGIAEPAWVAPASRRATSIFTSPNAVGLYLAPILLLYTGWLTHTWNTQRGGRRMSYCSFQLAVIALSLAAIAATKSEGTILGLLAGAFLLCFFGISRRATTVLAALAVLAVLAISPLRNQLIALFTFASPSGQNRLTLWTIAWDTLTSGISTFFFGAGIFGYSVIQNAARDPLKLEPLLYPHTWPLNFWVEYGLLGLAGFVWIFFNLIRTSAKAVTQKIGSRGISLGLIAALVAIAIHGVIDVPYFKNDLAVLFWILAGLTSAIPNVESQLSHST